MIHTHFFQLNIQKDNHLNGRTDGYIDIRATFNETYYDDDNPIVTVEPINLNFYNCIIVKNWLALEREAREAATKHFAEIAKAERINKARATLISEGEPSGNPIMDYYTQHNALS